MPRAARCTRCAWPTGTTRSSAPRRGQSKPLRSSRAGVVYAYNTVKGVKEVGNLAFVPLAKVNALR